jgi:hypothetical protein
VLAPPGDPPPPPPELIVQERLPAPSVANTYPLSPPSICKFATGSSMLGEVCKFALPCTVRSPRESMTTGPVNVAVSVIAILAPPMLPTTDNPPPI